MISDENHSQTGEVNVLSATADNSARPLRIGYVPVSSNLQGPGDRRRFVHYARQRNLSFEIANPDKSYDVVVVTQMADLSVWSRYYRGKIIYDAIDSYLVIPKTSVKGLLRGLVKYLAGRSRYLQLNYWKTIEHMCRRADVVICSTQEQHNDISKFCSNIHIVLDIHSGVTHTVKSNFDLNQPIRLVWEGLPQTLPSLASIQNVVRRLNRDCTLELHLVTDKSYYRYLQAYGKTDTLRSIRNVFPNAVLHEWKEDTCADIIASCDIAVIPLNMNDPFACGKPENKLLLLWRLGMPVVTSATPAYRRAMNRAGMDLTCSTENEWYATLKRMIQSKELRKESAIKGREYSEDKFDECKILSQWDAVFASIGFDMTREKKL